MTVTFGTLLLGFILLDIGHFGMPIMNKIGAIDLIICVGAAWYMMAAIVLNEVSGKELLKLGKPLINLNKTQESSKKRVQPILQKEVSARDN